MRRLSGHGCFAVRGTLHARDTTILGVSQPKLESDEARKPLGARAGALAMRVTLKNSGWIESIGVPVHIGWLETKSLKTMPGRCHGLYRKFPGVIVQATGSW